jgi:hypothetical protein
MILGMLLSLWVFFISCYFPDFIFSCYFQLCDMMYFPTLEDANVRINFGLFPKYLLLIHEIILDYVDKMFMLCMLGLTHSNCG